MYIEVPTSSTGRMDGAMSLSGWQSVAGEEEQEADLTEMNTVNGAEERGEVGVMGIESSTDSLHERMERDIGDSTRGQNHQGVCVLLPSNISFLLIVVWPDS